MNLWITRHIKLSILLFPIVRFDLLIAYYEFDQEDLGKLLEKFKLDPEEITPFLQKHGVKCAEVYVEYLAIYCILLSFDCCHIIPGSWIPLGRWTREFECSGARENEKNDRHGQGHIYTYFELQCVCYKTKSAGGTSVSRTTICASVSSNKWTSRWSCASVPEPAAISRLTTERNNTVMPHLLYCSIIGHDDRSC